MNVLLTFQLRFSDLLDGGGHCFFATGTASYMYMRGIRYAVPVT